MYIKRSRNNSYIMEFGESEENAFFAGRMISISKSMYKGNAVFNANLFTEEDGKLWHGDIDLDKDKSILLSLSREIGKSIYLLRESDGVFFKGDVDLSKAVSVYCVNGTSN